MFGQNSVSTTRSCPMKSRLSNATNKEVTVKSRILTCMIVFTSLAVPGGSAAQEQQRQNTDKPQHYAITDLGTLGGTFSAASGVNNEGDVVGASTLLGDMVVRVFL